LIGEIGPAPSRFPELLGLTVIVGCHRSLPSEKLTDVNGFIFDTAKTLLCRRKDFLDLRSGSFRIDTLRCGRLVMHHTLNDQFIHPSVGKALPVGVPMPVRGCARRFGGDKSNAPDCPGMGLPVEFTV
jgi:hypothetical protein